MKKGFYSRRLIAALMAALLSVNSLPVTVLAEETDLAGQSQAEAVMESGTEESDLTGESQAESVQEEATEEETETVLQRKEQSDELVDSGTCGENVTWTLDKKGVLTISGTGAMSDYIWGEMAPWYTYGEHIVSIVVDNGVTNIGDYAFYQCSNLSEISIPASVTKIGNYAFSYCSDLRVIDIPSEVTEIGDYAFCDCASLKIIEIPGKVTYIGNFVFCNCDNLSAINVAEDNTSYYSIDGVLFESYNPTIVYCPGKDREVYSIPDGIMNIGVAAFCGSINLKEIEIPASVTYIGGWAFSECRRLISIDLPENLNYIDMYAFACCDGLTSVEIPSNVTNIGEHGFGNCKNLGNITFKGVVPEFGEEVFADVTATVYYPANNLSWTGEVRQDYGGILTWKPYTTADIADSGTCGEDVTWTLNSDGLLTISGTGKMSDYTEAYQWPWYENREQIVSVAIEEGVTYIGYSAFEKFINLTSIEIPNSVTEIGWSAFADCSSLTEINIPRSVSFIGWGVFFGCKGLKAINVEEENANYFSKDGVLFSGTTLKYCPGSDRQEYVIPDGITSISEFAFIDCGELTKIKMSNSVTSIGFAAFEGCSGLKKLELPTRVNGIQTRAFSGCSGLTEITFKGLAPDFGEDAFSGVTATVYYPGNDSSWTEEVRQDYGGTLTWISYVAEEIVDSGTCGENLTWTMERNGVLSISGTGSMTDYLWEVKVPWYAYSEYIDSVVIDNGVTNIGDYAFYGCSKLSEISIPDKVTKIGDSAFEGCDKLTAIDIPNEVTYIGNYAFNGCSSLTRIDIPSKVTYIGSYAFSNSGNLSAINVAEDNTSYHSIDGVLFDSSSIIYCPGKDREAYIIPEGIMNIAGSAFSDCVNLKQVEIPDSVTYIGGWAFAGCSSLTSIDLPENLNYIEMYAFANCDGLTSIEIPNAVAYIRDDAFGGCENLTAIIFDGSAPQFGEDVFYNVTATAYYPANDSSWTDEVRQNYGGTITWVEVGSEPEEKELTIIQQPKSVTGKLGETAVFTVEAEGDGVTYQWQYCNNGSSTWKNSSMMGSTTNSIEVKITKGRIGQKYRCILQDSRDNKLVSEEAQIMLAEEKKLAVTRQPESVTGKIGETAVFTVGAEGDGVTYQWQYCNSGSNSWKNSSMTGADTNSIEVKITKGRIGQKYRCILKDSKGNKLTTEEAQIIQAEEKKLTVIQQPESVTGKIGETTVFTVEAEGEGVTYQWQYCNSGSSAWKNSSMTGSTTNSIEVKITKGRIGQKYRCILKDSKGNKLTTEEAQIKLAEEKELAIVKQPESVTGKVGETAIFTVEAEGEGVTYQWQYCNNGSTSWANSKMTGCDTNSIEVKITKGRIGQKYRCILKDSKGNKLTTEEAQIIQAEK